MNLIHLDKNNLHHAYLIEGEREVVVPEILEFLLKLGIKTQANPDFYNIQTDSFKIDDARNIKAYAGEKSFSSGKKVFIISTNSFLLEAQNSLLKMFEEPMEDTHFFLVMPEINSLIKTFVSRFYLISARKELLEDVESAKKFIKMPVKSRLDFIKDFLIEPDESDEDGNGVLAVNSTRSKALKFLNELESALSKGTFDSKVECIEHIFKVREFLRMPGSSSKMLLESVALVIPEKLL